MQNHTDILYRRSPIAIGGQPKKVGLINGFKVILEYDDESQKKGATLTDLSHLAKWDIQGSDLEHIVIDGEGLPATPGKCRFRNGAVLFRLNRTHAGIWHVCAGDAPGLPDDSAFTDTTDAWTLFGLAGEAIPELFEQITELDLLPPAGSTPAFLQGPIFDVWSRIVIIGRSKDFTIAIIAFPRGFGQSAAQALLDMGSAIGLHLTGANAFFYPYLLPGKDRKIDNYGDCLDGRWP